MESGQGTDLNLFPYRPIGYNLEIDNSIKVHSFMVSKHAMDSIQNEAEWNRPRQGG